MYIDLSYLGFVRLVVLHRMRPVKDHSTCLQAGKPECSACLLFDAYMMQCQL